jgi:hypothetical protein
LVVAELTGLGRENPVVMVVIAVMGRQHLARVEAGLRVEKCDRASD